MEETLRGIIRYPLCSYAIIMMPQIFCNSSAFSSENIVIGFLFQSDAMNVLDVCSPVKDVDQGKMMLMLLLVFHCLIMVTIAIYLVNTEPSLQLQTGSTDYTEMLGLDFSLGEQQQRRYK